MEVSLGAKKRNSGWAAPSEENKNSIAARNSDFFLPIQEAKIPEIALPIMHPIKALETVAPW